MSCEGDHNKVEVGAIKSGGNSINTSCGPVGKFGPPLLDLAIKRSLGKNFQFGLMHLYLRP